MPKPTALIGEKSLESCCILIRIAKPPGPAMRLIAIWPEQDGWQTTAIVTCFVAGRPNSKNFERFDRLVLSSKRKPCWDGSDSAGRESATVACSRCVSKAIFADILNPQSRIDLSLCRRHSLCASRHAWL